MSTLSALSGSSGTSWAALLERIAQSNQTSGTSSSSKAAGTADNPENFLTSELEKQGYSGSKLSDLQSKISSAVQSLQSSTSGPVDPAKVHDAINGVLKDAGVNTDQIDADFKSQGPRGPGGPPRGMGGQGGVSTDSSTNMDDSISSLLTSLGVDPQKFESALESALQNRGSDGSFDLSKLFASAGSGSQVNVLA